MLLLVLLYGTLFNILLRCNLSLKCNALMTAQYHNEFQCDSDTLQFVWQLCQSCGNQKWWKQYALQHVIRIKHTDRVFLFETLLIFVYNMDVVSKSFQRGTDLITYVVFLLTVLVGSYWLAFWMIWEIKLPRRLLAYSITIYYNVFLCRYTSMQCFLQR